MADALLENVDPDNNFFNEISSFLPHIQQSQYYTIEQYNTQFHNSHFCIFSLNIRSFNANIESFVAIMHSLRELSDVIVLTETWIGVDNVERSGIEGYTCWHTIREEGGAVACLYFAVTI